MIRGFDPIVGKASQVLVLGTIPSERSLQQGEYYAHPQNAFWPIMERLFSQNRGMTYAERTALLEVCGVALWDVLRAVERPGSLDSAIVADTAVPNDIAALLAEQPGIRAVFFNGATAEKLFRSHVLLTLPAGSSLTFTRLPSTSPAHAALSFPEKLAAWQVVAEAARGTSRS